jgi:hypothetical protein
VAHSFEKVTSQHIDKINAESFTDIALELFHYQYAQNSVYRSYTDALKILPKTVNDLFSIPYLPVSFFKTHDITTRSTDLPELIFESSGTTGEVPSKHRVHNPELYEASLLRGFRKFYGNPGKYAILALLPSYLERKNASLVHMAETLMKASGHPSNGFYLNEWEKLSDIIIELERKQQPTLLLGVTFALLDFAAASQLNLKHTIVMETGGMKGRREEWTRTQVHEYLKNKWQLEQVHSEYGMTEMLSQAYAMERGIFRCSESMQVFVRDLNDPLEITRRGSGCLNIIDLANVDSCAFIATEDLGTIHPNGSFEVFGRMDHAALRGCSLMTA